MLTTTQRIFDNLDRAQARVDSALAKYERIGKILAAPFLTGEMNVDAYLTRSRRLNARFQRELDRIHL